MLALSASQSTGMATKRASFKQAFMAEVQSQVANEAARQYQHRAVAAAP